jgi:hypothetical protein
MKAKMSEIIVIEAIQRVKRSIADLFATDEEIREYARFKMYENVLRAIAEDNCDEACAIEALKE